MKITFEQYLKSYENVPDWLDRPTRSDYDKIQEECLLAEFLRYLYWNENISKRDYLTQEGWDVISYFINEGML